MLFFFSNQYIYFNLQYLKYKLKKKEKQYFNNNNIITIILIFVICIIFN